jgi:steroid delta-isomerase-like uncharacterized protein
MPAADTEVDVRAFADRYVAAWNTADEAAIAELVTADVVWADPALPEPLRGVAEVQVFMRASVQTFPDLHFSEPDPPHVFLSGTVAAWAWVMEGTMRGPVDPPGFAATGQHMRVEGVDVWQLREGRIERYRAYYDMADLARQLGLAPARGGAAERAAVALQRVQARLRR